MPDAEKVSESSTTGGIPVAPSLGPALQAVKIPHEPALVGVRVLWIGLLSAGVGAAASYIAYWLVNLINFFTNLSFFGRLSMSAASPGGNHLGAWVVLVPVIGGLVVGLMARFGSKAIRGHGIPEAMEQVLTNRSRIPARVLWLKPLSAAVAIGTGGPFGAEGPIISTGGAVGSLVGQLIPTSAEERKTLLAAGAAAGMTAIFGTPVAAVLLAIELLLFEFRPRSLIPVTLAAVTSMGTRHLFFGWAPVFPMPGLEEPTGAALASYIAVGGAVGFLAVLATRLVYAIEDGFARLPVHWMWWPAIGALAVGIVGYFSPLTLGVGYDNIDHILDGSLAGGALAFLAAMKLASWSVSLSSGTSGGTLAPLFTVGGAAGALMGAGLARLAPGLHVDPRVAGLVGMAAIFSGASRALLASVIFAFEATREPLELLPLLGGGAAAYLVSCFLMRSTIMTEKIERRGVRVPSEYTADCLDQVLVKDAASKDVATLRSEAPLEEILGLLRSHEGFVSFSEFPVIDHSGALIGMIHRRQIEAENLRPGAKIAEMVRRPMAVVYEDCTLRQARDHMAHEGVDRLPVVSRGDRHKVVGILSHKDILSSVKRFLDESRRHD